jgi:hypothetical protein
LPLFFQTETLPAEIEELNPGNSIQIKPHGKAGERVPPRLDTAWILACMENGQAAGWRRTSPVLRLGADQASRSMLKTDESLR